MVFVGGGGFFNFYRIDCTILQDEEIYFFSVSIPVAIERGHVTVVPVAFQQFTHDPRFQNGAGHCAGFQCFRAGPFGEVGTQSGIEKIEFGTSHQSFGEVGIIGFQKIDDSGSL